VYELKGFRLPFVVLVKMGAEGENRKAGNRGKRDSQMMLMRFLQRIYSEEAMSPMERELAYHIERTAGKRVKEYEFLLFVDADTTIKEQTITKMVSTMIGNSKIIGCCGDTLVANNKSITTAIQMFEYFISHHFLKAFESWLGSVTCLPGCLCMYRIRTITSNGRAVKPLLVAPKIINDYSVTVVDTLHKKNLLSLGEDRYLTTLMLKHFPDYKTVFVPDAQCETKVPERWAVLLSQRRRWINSTFHNLFELLGLSQLKGCLCFGLRFIVLLEFVSTMIMPATILYLYYLTYQIIMQREMLPIMSLGLLAFMYGLQLLISFYKKHPEHVFYMIIYLLATFPFAALSIYLPLYCFWQQDNFTWGDTRIVMSEGKIEEQGDDEEADHAAIPREPWNRKTYVPVSTASRGIPKDDDSDDEILTGRPSGSQIGRNLSYQQMPPSFGAAAPVTYPSSALLPSSSSGTLTSAPLYFEAAPYTAYSAYPQNTGLPMPYAPSAFGPIYAQGPASFVSSGSDPSVLYRIPVPPPPSVAGTSFYRDIDVNSSVSQPKRSKRRSKKTKTPRPSIVEAAHE
jgi:chitin synthase